MTLLVWNKPTFASSNIRTMFLFSCLLSFLLCAPLRAFDSADDSLRVQVLAFRGHSADSLRIDVYLAIPLRSLHFIEKNNAWLSQYQVQVQLRGATSALQSWQSGVQTQRRGTNPQHTEASTRLLHQASFYAVPGSFEVVASMHDELSGRTMTTYEQIRLPSLVNTPSISSLLLLSAVERREASTVISPFISDNVSVFHHGFFVFFESYGAPSFGSVHSRLQLLDDEHEVWSAQGPDFSLSDNRSQQYVHVDLPDDLDNGHYTLRLELLSPNNSASAPTVIASRDRSIELNDPMRFVQDLTMDVSIDQLRYAATQSQLDSMRSLPDLTYRKRALDMFWTERDPTPGTQRNEARDEYVMRVEEATKLFEGDGDGWLSDRGMVYVILGPPSDQHTDVSNDGRKFIVWNYSSPRRRFVFVDDGNFGSYRLSATTPFSSAEKYHYLAK